MITFAFFLVVTLLSLLLAFFDMMLFEYSFLEALKNLFVSEIAAGRYIVITGAVVGLISSIVLDIRLYLAKKSGKNVKGNQV